MKRSQRHLAVVALALALLTFPALAAAKPGYEVRPKSLKLELRAEASNGYAVTVETVGHKQVVLTVEGHGGSATYQVVGHVSRHGIEAEFGELGHIDLRFKGVRKPERPLGGIPLPPGLLDEDCKGRHPIREVGVFRGSFEFEGEHGFTGVDTGKVRGAVRRTFRQVCKPERRGPARASARSEHAKRVPILTVELLAAQGSPERHVALATYSFQSPIPELQELGDAFSFVFASVEERNGAVRISRSSFAGAGAGSILVSPPGKKPATVSLAFAKPFVGTAKFVRQEGAPPTWIGSLGVHLPGGGLTPLTGPGFAARLCRVRLTSERSACAKRSEAELGVPSDLS